jgi:hypothetical protein
VALTNATGCPCRLRAALFLTGVGYMVPHFTDVTLTTVGERTHLAMTGAARNTTSGAKTVEIRTFRLTGSGAAPVYGPPTVPDVPRAIEPIAPEGPRRGGHGAGASSHPLNSPAAPPRVSGSRRRAPASTAGGEGET